MWCPAAPLFALLSRSLRKNCVFPFSRASGCCASCSSIRTPIYCGASSLFSFIYFAFDGDRFPELSKRRHVAQAILSSGLFSMFVDAAFHSLRCSRIEAPVSFSIYLSRAIFGFPRRLLLPGRA